MLDVTTKALNQGVGVTLDRFPGDFLFRLVQEEVETLNRSQSVTGYQKHRNPRYPPFAFTEHGAIMNSSRAVDKIPPARLLDSELFGRLIIEGDAT